MAQAEHVTAPTEGSFYRAAEALATLLHNWMRRRSNSGGGGYGGGMAPLGWTGVSMQMLVRLLRKNYCHLVYCLQAASPW